MGNFPKSIHFAQTCVHVKHPNGLSGKSNFVSPCNLGLFSNLWFPDLTNLLPVMVNHLLHPWNIFILLFCNITCTISAMCLRYNLLN